MGFYHYNLLVYYWALRHPKDLFGAKTLLRDHVCELALEKGDGNVGRPGGKVLDEALSSGSGICLLVLERSWWSLQLCGGEFGWTEDVS